MTGQATCVSMSAIFTRLSTSSCNCSLLVSLVLVALFVCENDEPGHRLCSGPKESLKIQLEGQQRKKDSHAPPLDHWHLGSIF